MPESGRKNKMNDEFSLGGNPNEGAEEVNEDDKEAVITTIKKPETEAKSRRKSSIEIKTKELDDFISDVTRLSEILNSISKKFDSIEKSTAVVHKLEDIANMDLKEFKSKFEDMVNSLDLNKYAKEAVQDALKPLTAEYKDSNDLLKNLIFELEKRHIPTEKKTSKLKVMLIAGLFLAAVGVGGYFIYTTSNSKSSGVTAISTKTKNIIIKKGVKVIRVNDGKRLSVPGEMRFSSRAKGDYFYFNHNGLDYRVLKSKAIVY